MTEYLLCETEDFLCYSSVIFVCKVSRVEYSYFNELLYPFHFNNRMVKSTSQPPVTNMWYLLLLAK